MTELTISNAVVAFGPGPPYNRQAWAGIAGRTRTEVMEKAAATRLVLCDRDGTIIVDRDYLTSADGVELLPGAAEGLKHVARLGLLPVVVTNQSAIGRGWLDWPALEAIHERLRFLLAEAGAAVAGIYVCPHRPEDGCACRKPGRALADRAARDFGADLSRSFVMGVKASDLELARRVGATAILVRTGYGAEVEAGGQAQPDYVADDLAAAARFVERLLAPGGSRQPGRE